MSEESQKMRYETDEVVGFTGLNEAELKSQLKSKKDKLSEIRKIAKHDLFVKMAPKRTNIVLEKFFLEETFINEPHLFTVHKNLFQISHRLRSEVFDDIANLNYSKYVNNEKLKLLINIKEIDYKSLYRRVKKLKKSLDGLESH